MIQQYNPDRVASVGGDGTTLFTAEVLLNSDLPMGIIPLGSANGMAVELFVNPEPMEALKELVMSRVVAGLDLIQVNNQHYCMHIGDVGINARIVEAYERDSNRGMATYARYFLEELKRTDPFTVWVKANGEMVEKRGVMVGLCNARKYGTGVPLNLTGNPMDGRFEIVVVQNIDLNSLVKAGLSKFNEKFHDSQNGFVISTEEAEIKFNRPSLLQLDGEVIGEFEKLDVKLINGGVKLITHFENSNLLPID